MASNKPSIPIPVPHTGVRMDVNPLVRTPEMASRGDNCIFFDGVIRPRPALTAEIGDESSLFPEFKLWLDGTSLTPYIFTATEVTDDGYTLLSVNDNSFHLSLDLGETWEAAALNHPATSISHLEEQNGFLFAFTTSALYRAPVSTLPSSLSWTNVVGSGPPGLSVNKYHYDETNDAWLVLGDGATNITPKVTAFYDASTGSVTAPAVSAGESNRR